MYIQFLLVITRPQHACLCRADFGTVVYQLVILYKPHFLFNKTQLSFEYIIEASWKVKDSLELECKPPLLFSCFREPL